MNMKMSLPPINQTSSTWSTAVNTMASRNIGLIQPLCLNPKLIQKKKRKSELYRITRYKVGRQNGNAFYVSLTSDT